MIGLSTVGCILMLIINDGPHFQGVGFNDPSHDESEVYAVSPDGTHVVGFSQLTTGVAPMEGGTLWYPNGSFEVIPSPGSSGALTYPNAVGPGGNQVVGTYFSAEAFAFSWLAESGSSLLSLGGATAMSGDGAIVCGAEAALVDGFSILAAWRIENGQKTYLGGFPQTWQEDRTAKAMSMDGQFIAGVERDVITSQLWRPYIWENQAGFEYLPTLPEWTNIRVEDLSQDATKVVGAVFNGADREAALWQRALAPVGLGDFPGGTFESGATAISPGGNWVMGFGTTGEGRKAFLWHADTGLQILELWLEEKFGLALGGWTLLTVHGLSANGKVLVGVGVNPDGRREGWVLRLGSAVLGLVDHLESWDSGEVDVTDMMGFL